MDGNPPENPQEDRSSQFLQVDLTPRTRKISSPYPLYPFKKPEDYHPSIQPPSSYQPQTYPTNDQPPPDYQPQMYPPREYPVNYHPEDSTRAVDKPHTEQSRNHAKDYLPGQRGKEAKPSRSQSASSDDDVRRHGNRPRSSEEGQSDPAITYRVSSGEKDSGHRRKEGIAIPQGHPVIIHPPGSNDDGRESVDSDPDLHQGQGSMTDDDKLNESEKDRKLDHKPDITSDDEAERGLAILRKFHEQTEVARRLRESGDVREDDNYERREREKSPEGEEPQEKVAESGSTTPTPSEPDPAVSQDDSTMEEGEEEEEEEEDEETDVPQTPQPLPFSPVTLLPPADMDVYYSLSKRRYHVAPSFSEPSRSRQISPSSNTDSLRTQSQLQGPIDDPGGRYARRATRASVLNRAESLLHSRLHSRSSEESLSPRQNGPMQNRSLILHSPRTSGFASSRRSKRYNGGIYQKPMLLHRIREMSGRQKKIEQKFSESKPVVKRVAFVDVGDEDWDDEEVTSFRATGNTPAMTSLGEVEGGREGNVSSRLSTSRRHYSNNQRSNDVIFPVRRRTGNKAGGRFTGKKLRGFRGSRSSQNSQQNFSGSEDDVAHYGLRDYSDPARFEMTRGPPPSLLLPPVHSNRPDGEQGSKKARRVWFFRNGDPDSKARLMVVSQKLYPNMDSLLMALENVVPIVSGVKHIFSLPEGRKVRAVRELQDGCYYVCSGVNRLYDVKYGDVREHHWKGGRVLHEETHLFSRPNPLDLRADMQSPPPLFPTTPPPRYFPGRGGRGATPGGDLGQ